jgi:hypothetical protein
MEITSHASCAPIPEINPDGSVRFACMEYIKKGRRSFRHIMETGKNRQSILETLKEGVLKEGAKDRSEFEMHMLSDEPIHFEFVQDEKRPGGHQIKVAFPVWVRPEHLRNFEVKDDDDLDEIHGPFKMYEFTELARLERQMIPFHFRVARSALVWAATREKKVLERYYDHIVGWPRTILIGEQKEALSKYSGRW